MTTPFWCLLIAILIPYVLAGLTGYFKTKQFGSIDTHHPRKQSAELEGAGARTHGAQLNAWEALTLFGISVLIAHVAGADPGASALASISFVVARVLHAVFYITDRPPLRTATFTVGFACCLWLFGLAAVA